MLFCFSTYSYTSLKNLFFNPRRRAVRVSRATPAKSIIYQGHSVFRQEKTPFCTMTEGRTCPLPFSCHSQHTLVFTFSGNSSGSVSSQIQPSQFPSGIVWIYSTLQLRDSAGFSPAYLLSLYQTPDSLIILILYVLPKISLGKIIP